MQLHKEFPGKLWLVVVLKEQVMLRQVHLVSDIHTQMSGNQSNKCLANYGGH